jgi:hypothetical protein
MVDYREREEVDRVGSGHEGRIGVDLNARQFK